MVTNKHHDLDKSFLKSLKTKEEANKFFEFADKVKNKSYEVKKITENMISQCFKDVTTEIPEKTKWFLFIKERLGSKLNIDSVKSALGEIENQVSRAQLVKLEISFVPSESFINDIYQEIEKSGSENFLLDVEVNPSMSAGAKVFIGGKYVNLTIGSVVNKYLRTKDVINKYL